jgi:hypothetical protein
MDGSQAANSRYRNQNPQAAHGEYPAMRRLDDRQFAIRSDGGSAIRGPI